MTRSLISQSSITSHCAGLITCFMQPKNLLQYVQQLLLWGLTLSAAAAQDTFSTVYETIGTLYETTSSFTRAAADQLHSWAVAIATPSSSGSRSSIIMRMRSAYLRRWRATSNMAGISSKSQPSFVHQYYWCLSRAILLRSREPMMVSKTFCMVCCKHTRRKHQHKHGAVACVPGLWTQQQRSLYIWTNLPRIMASPMGKAYSWIFD